MNKSLTDTSVSKKDLPKIAEPTLTNLPADLDIAIARIMALELALEDLARAAEIAAAVGQTSILEGFVQSANILLSTKVEIVQPNFGEFKVTVITDEKHKDDAKV